MSKFPTSETKIYRREGGIKRGAVGLLIERDFFILNLICGWYDNLRERVGEDEEPQWGKALEYAVPENLWVTMVMTALLA